jgi:hypothetical protein
MNLHGIVAPYISAVNPLETVLLLRSAGYTTNASGKRIAQFQPAVAVITDLQALSKDDLHQLEGLNIQGYRRALYINGASYGVVRPDQLGGDLVVRSYGTTWLNVQVLEPWNDWMKFVVTRQNYSAVSNTPPLDFSNPGALTYTVPIV